ncbi:MAG: Sec-independent protein translocase protein TatB [Gammaproteobacteria bacterium]|jgi:sec-independent protein translocase protein TatB
MFDIGFWELAFIGVIALLVFGPERLPEVARTAGLWVNRIRRFIAGVKRDVEQELRAEELKRILKQPNPLNEVHEILEETRQSLEKPVTKASPDLPAATRSPQQEAPPKRPELEGEPRASMSEKAVPSASESPPNAAPDHDRQTAQN